MTPAIPPDHLTINPPTNRLSTNEFESTNQLMDQTLTAKTQIVPGKPLPNLSSFTSHALPRSERFEREEEEESCKLITLK
jgi:hypothetical protein